MPDVTSFSLTFTNGSRSPSLYMPHSEPCESPDPRSSTSSFSQILERSSDFASFSYDTLNVPFSDISSNSESIESVFSAAQTPHDFATGYGATIELDGMEYDRRDSIYSTISSHRGPESEKSSSRKGMFDLEDEIRPRLSQAWYTQTAKNKSRQENDRSPPSLPAHAADLGLGISAENVKPLSGLFGAESASASLAWHSDVQESCQASSALYSNGQSGPTFLDSISAYPRKSSKDDSEASEWSTALPYLQQDVANAAGNISHVLHAYAESSIADGGNKTDSYVSTSRSSFDKGEYSLETELEEMLFATGESPGRHSFHGGWQMHVEAKAVQSIENGKGLVVVLNYGQPVESLTVPRGMPVAKHRCIQSVLTYLQGTTHLILAGSLQPKELFAMLSSTLPTLAETLLVLDISSCSLASIPEGLSFCSHLEELNISNNPIQFGTFPNFFFLLRSLRVLIADNCGFSHISRPLVTFQSLHTLSLRDNHLRCLPSWLRHLSKCLEILLVNGNPFYGAYAELVKPLLALTAPTSSSNIVKSVDVDDSRGHPAPVHFSSSPILTSPSLLELYSDNRKSTSGLETPASYASLPWIDPSPSLKLSPPQSRMRLRKHGYKMHHTQDIPSGSDRNSTRVNSLLLADSGVKKASVHSLKPIKSMGDLHVSRTSAYDLSVPFDSIAQGLVSAHNLITGPFDHSVASSTDFLREEDPAYTTLAEFLLSKESQKASPPSMSSRKHSRSASHKNCYSAVNPESNAGDGDILQSTEYGPRPRKLSFFRKISLVADKLSRVQKKNSVSALRSDGKSHSINKKTIRTSQVGLGRAGKPLDAALDNDVTRSVSDPLASRPMSISVRNRRAGMAEKASSPGKTLSTTTRGGKRKSYLTLDSTLPPVISPAPLSMTFAKRLSRDSTLRTYEREENNHTISTTPDKCVPEPPEVATLDNTAAPGTRADSKSALAPLMAYLGDLDDLTHDVEGPALQSYSPDASHVLSAVSRQPSLTAVSTASSGERDLGIYSEDESSRPNEALLASRRVTHGEI